MPRDTSKYEGLPSVTECIDLANYIDLSMIHFDVLEEARVRGSSAHDWIKLITNEPDTVRGVPVPELIAPYISAWEKWRVESGFEILNAEQVVVSKEHGFAGTYDIFGTINGRWALPDYKCRYGLTPEIGPQTAGYVLALDFEEPVLRFALMLRRDGSYRFEPMTNRLDRHAFISAVNVAHWQLNNGITSLDKIRRAA